MPGKLKWLFLIIILLAGPKYAKAQYYDYWAFGYHFGLKFNSCPVSVEKNSFSTSGYDLSVISSTICDSLGNLLLYTNGKEVYTADGKLVENGKLSMDVNSWDQVILIPKGRTAFYLLAYRDTTAIVNNIPDVPLPTSGLYSSVVRKDNSGKYIIQPWEKDIPVFFSFSFSNVTAIKGASDDYWLICRSADTLLACDFDSIGLKRIVKTTIQEPLNNNLVTVYNNYPSNDGKSLVSISNCILDNQYPDLNNPKQGSYSYLYSFDKYTGAFSDQILLDSFHRISARNLRTSVTACFSPNDSLIYIGGYDFGPLYQGYIYQYPRYNSNPISQKKSIILPDSGGKFNFVQDMKLGPDGKIYVLKSDQCSISVINRPDNFGNCDLHLDAIDMHCYDGKHNEFPFYFTNTPSSYLKLRYRAGTTCGYLNLIAETDSLFHTYQWNISSAKGYTYHASGRQASAPVNTAGWYYITLTGIAKTGYSRCYTDSFLIPAQPKANFSASTDSICAYNPIQFYDSSTVDSSKINNESWQWDFGDGQSSTLKNPTHSYTSAGAYSIRLVVNDGICSDTFIYPKKIIVRDAPRPGFDPTPGKGCAPLSVLMKPYTASSILKYRYYFGDGYSDSVAAPEHIFTAPGKYMIRQYLYSPFGCITQDSEVFTVFKGIDISKSSNISSVSVLPDQTLKITWDSLPGATTYILKRTEDAAPSTTLVFYCKGDSFTDHDVNTDQHKYTYEVLAQDTCENLSAKGSSGSSILLKASNSDNNYAQLQWSSYDLLKAGAAQYSIQRSDDGKTYYEIARIASDQLQYDDKSFYTDSLSYRTYRITALLNNRKAANSNAVKVPYDFTLWIPNSFSPNGDGLNDRFEIKAEKGTSLHMDVYNQWGELVFSTNDINNSWDGTFRGKKAAEGIYLYKAEIKSPTSGNFYKSGTIQILK
jgi:gliding motility-associated-like protein